MQNEIKHILLENYPNPPPPGFPFPPLPKIVHINENESNNDAGYFMTTPPLSAGITENDVQNKNGNIISPTAYVVSVDEPTEITPEMEECIKMQNASYKTIEQKVIEVHSQQIGEEQVVEITVLERKIESVSDYTEEDPITEIKTIDYINNENLGDKSSFNIASNVFPDDESDDETIKTYPIVVFPDDESDDEFVKTYPIIEHKFVEYPHSPPSGLSYTSVPKIVPDYLADNSDEELSLTKPDDNLNVSKIIVEETKIPDENNIENIKDQKSNGITERSSIDETSTIEEDIKELHKEIENHTSSGPILGQTTITSQPKTNNDESIKRFSQKTIPEEGTEPEQKRIKTTICCCIKC